jgi:hypothetical protein
MVFVGMARPEEAFQPILSAAGDDVKVHMRHALADAVVHGDKRAVRGQSFFNGLSQQLGMREERGDQRLRKVGQRFIVVFRNQKAMTLKKGPMIEERYGDFALKDNGRIKVSSDDTAKCATLSHVAPH